MSKIEQRPKVEVDCIIRLTEGEMRFLDALVGYGWDSFIKLFREKLGVSYIRDYEKDGQALFEQIRSEFPFILRRANEAREVFSGEKKGSKGYRCQRIESPKALCSQSLLICAKREKPKA